MNCHSNENMIKKKKPLPIGMEPFVSEIGVKLTVKLVQQCWKWEQLYNYDVFFFLFNL